MPPRAGAPGANDQALETAIGALRAGRPAEAERLAGAVLRADRRHSRAAQVLGQALLLQNRPDDALATLRPLARRGEDPAIETLLARALAALGRRDEALTQLRKAAARRPPFALAFLDLGEMLGKQGRLDESEAVFRDGLALMPYAAVLRVGLGHLGLRRNDRASARAHFSQVHAAAPDRHDALAGLARVSALDGDYAAAADLYRRALALRPGDPAALIALGKCLLELREREAAEAVLRQAAAGGGTGLALTALSATPHGRLFLRPSDAAAFLAG
jgi:tetratricopeptide (TPR) repeat protein